MIENRDLSRRAGFTLVEVMVVVILFSMIIFAVWKVFSSGIRGSQFAQETIDHIRDSAVLFRSIDRDIQRMIPWPVRDSENHLNAGNIKYFPTKQAAREICFWIRNGSGLQQIRYRFITNPDGKKLYREEMNATGSIERAENFGGNLIESFKLSDYDGAGKRLKVTVVFCSRLKKNTMFEKVFTMGISAPDEARHWVYDLTG